MLMAHRIARARNNKQATYFAKAAGAARFVYHGALVEWSRPWTAGERDRNPDLQPRAEGRQPEHPPRRVRPRSAGRRARSANPPRQPGGGRSQPVSPRTDLQPDLPRRWATLFRWWSVRCWHRFGTEHSSRHCRSGDHTRVADTQRFVERVDKEQGARVGVNDVWGGGDSSERSVPCWYHGFEAGLQMLERAVDTLLRGLDHPASFRRQAPV